MKNRYTNTRLFNNTNVLFADEFEDRGVKYIRQYTTTPYKELTEDQKGSLVAKKVEWQNADRLDKIAAREYNNSEYWWIIARYNGKPTDAHFRPGDELLVPHPLTLILGYYTEV